MIYIAKYQYVSGRKESNDKNTNILNGDLNNNFPIRNNFRKQMLLPKIIKYYNIRVTESLEQLYRAL